MSFCLITDTLEVEIHKHIPAFINIEKNENEMNE